MNHENYDPCFPDQPVVDLYLPIWANLPAFRSKPAFIWAEDGTAGVTTGSTLTYSQLHNSVQSISSNLHSTLQRGDIVLILCSPGLELVEIIFGCQRAGLLAVPISPPQLPFTSHNHHHLVRALSQTKPKAAIAQTNYIKYLKKHTSLSNNNNLRELLQNLQWISTEEIKNNVYNKWDSSLYNGCKPDDLYLIQYTSGATAIPKPVLVTAGAAAHNVRTARKAYDLDPNSVIVSWLPQYHDCGLMFLLLTVVSGSTCVLTSPSMFINRPRLWLELLTEFKGTCTPVPSFTLPLVLKRGMVDKSTKPINLWSLKNLIIINEPILKSSIQEFLEVFKPFGLNPSSISPSYGLAENCTFVSTSWRHGEENNRFPHHNKLLPSARLGPHSVDEDEDEEIHIIVVNEETFEPVEDGIEGEIWVSSPSNAKGYLAHPSLTREVFRVRLRNKLSQSFLRTGDRGIVKGKDRYLYVTGRSSDMIKLHENQQNQEKHPHYIETTAYNSCPKLLRGGCIAAFKVSGTIAVVAELQRSENEIWVLRKICEKIREAVMEEEKVQIGFVVLVKNGGVPRTTSGKIQRWVAKHKLLEGELNVIMHMKFDDHGGNSMGMGVVKGVSERNRGGRRSGEPGEGRRTVAVGDERESVFLAPANGPAHLSLVSSL